MDDSGPSGFEDLDLDIFYTGSDEILPRFLLPVLEKSVAYDRLTGFFSVNSLIAISTGLESLWRCRGTMRLVLGLHDVPSELAEAADADAHAIAMREIEDSLLREIQSLGNHLAKQRIETLSWMLSVGLLQVRVANPKAADARNIFHCKRLIFRDVDGRVISAVGSPNETLFGIVGNYEELTVHASWWPDARYVDRHLRQFEEIWENQVPGLDVFELSSDFGKRLAAALGQNNPKQTSLSGPDANGAYSALLKEIRNAPRYAHLNYPSVVLYPHQERALFDSLNRNPVRVILADEVGLGKTLEAGAVIKHLIDFKKLSSAVIMVPASVLLQFQEEISSFFGLNFHRWDSNRREFISAKGERISASRRQNPLHIGSPRYLVISSQYARGSSSRPDIFVEAEWLPELLVVDEAHAARVHPDGDGGVRPTLLWETINAVASKISNLLLLTATPLQIDPLEFHGLLKLVGLGPAWESRKNYLQSLEILASANQEMSLQDATLLGKLILEGLALGHFSATENQAWSEFTTSLHQAEKKGLPALGLFVRSNRTIGLEILSHCHPANALMIRNTRSTLTKWGYKFPERDFVAPSLPVPQALGDFLEALNVYLEKSYGDTETAIYPNFANSRGFVKSGYQQRLASSLFSAYQSLGRRLEKLDGYIRLAREGRGVAAADFSADLDVDEAEEVGEWEAVKLDSESAQRLLAKGIVERANVESLLQLLEALEEGVLGADPKFTTALSLIDTYDVDPILIFSRYTDSLVGFVSFIEEFRPSLFERGIGFYTGGDCWIQIGATRETADKKKVKESLDSGKIHFVICSDAASEGLNLQKARVLINIDVPWNPARLEQRIGRVARLGQKAETVLIANLWYPKSVEARMYGRLLSRKGLYELAVGEFPDLFATEIRTAASGGQIPTADGVIENLENARQSVQHKALNRVWDFNKKTESNSVQILRELQQLVNENFGKEFQVSSFADDSLTQLRSPIGLPTFPKRKLFKLSRDSLALGFAIETTEGFAAVKDDAIARLLFASLGVLELTNSDLTTVVMKDALEDLADMWDGNFPGPRENRIEFPGWVDSSLEKGELRMELIGEISAGQDGYSDES